MFILSPSLPSLKGLFPFRLATTSYILPAAIAPNVRFTGPLVDEVELVLFESRGDDDLPAPDEIGALSGLAREYDLTYNVHLPTDVFLGHPDGEVRRQAADTILRFYERTAPLHPTLYVLHLERNPSGNIVQTGLPDWQGYLRSSLAYLLERGMEQHLLGIENIDYPFRWIYPLIRDLGLGICLDIGHLLARGEGLPAYLEAFGPEIVMVHLHGVAGGKDHQSLEEISAPDWQIITDFLADYHGGVSLEVFSREDLTSSLARMDALRSVGCR